MSYWERRQEETYKAGEMTVNQYFTGLEKAFNQAKRELLKTVESFYWRYAEENGLTYAEAQKRLDKAEMKGLREFIDLAMQNIGKYNQEVNNKSIRARMTRYQALEAQVDAILNQLYAVDYQANAEKMMSDVYTDTYHRTWYDADRYRGFHAQFAQIEPRTIEAVLKYPFNGANFSDRLWKQKEHLQGQIMESLTNMMIQGASPQNLAKDFAKKMQAKKFDAYRLLHTESSYVMSEATHAGYKEDGVEQYQILATLDSKTCGICGRLDGKIYPVSEAVTGKNMPPFHPFCRCTDVPYYPDTPTEGMTRAARDKDGHSIEMPESMTYEEWKKKYLDESVKDTEQLYRPVDRGEKEQIDIGKGKQVSIRKVESYPGEVYVSDAADIKPKALHEINKNTEDAMKKWGIPPEKKPKTVIVSSDELGAYGKYDAVTNTVYYVPQIVVGDDTVAPGDTEYHEMWHLKQAEDYRKSGKTITQENKRQYMIHLCKQCKKRIDKLGINEYNVSEISRYAMNNYMIGRFDEVEADYMMVNRKGKVSW